MSRLTKLDRMTVEQKTAEAINFWAADNNATFTPEVLSIVFKKSLPWFQLKRCTGDGIPFYKEGRTILYKKEDAINYFSANKFESTSQLTA
ncbi:DNA-binding protein [Acinetobacter wuhouensis]|uniref:DNA-binding protein n=1 Tax=Acinetobacter wuhouensis TaxID=1879050 RepID=UPI00102368CD|nr:DNA-binding protein [Acinetobacter wuhouensis]RZG71869.1 DNA-binding protein [Acinetobacter wuhouensis]